MATEVKDPFAVDEKRPRRRGPNSALRETSTNTDRQKLDILWKDYESRMKAVVGAPQQIGYRCVEVVDKPILDENGNWTGRTVKERCGEVVMAGSHDERVKTGEIVLCPNPAHRGQLTPMEPIL